MHSFIILVSFQYDVKININFIFSKFMQQNNLIYGIYRSGHEQQHRCKLQRGQSVQFSDKD